MEDASCILARDFRYRLVFPGSDWVRRCVGSLFHLPRSDRRAFQDVHHLLVAPRFRQRQRRIALPVRQPRAGARSHQRPQRLDMARSAVAELQLLSLDERVRRSGKALGLTVVPG